MTDAEQFLADFEAKAKAATPGIWEKHCDTKYGYATIDIDGVCEFIQAYTSSPNRYDNAAFIAAANPAAVLRLVRMVRWLSPVLHKFCEELCTPYKIGNGTCTECPFLRDGKCIVSAEAMLSTAYAETEDRHD